jgi:HAMP domain-containing protein/CheY-like chemotaxis protein/signal transduction histidine kinase
VRARRGNGGAGNGAGDAAPPARGRRGNGGGDGTGVAEPRARGRGNGGGAGGDGGGVLPMRRLLTAMRALRAGDFTVRLPDTTDPLMDEIFETFNEIASLNDRVAREMTRVATTVGREGQMSDRAAAGPVTGGWAQELEAVNGLIVDLTQPTTEVARVLTAVARGDLSQKMVLEIDGKSVQGEFLRIGTTVNTLVDQLSAFASEVTRVAREVGTEGRLGGQANVPGVAGTWKDLTDSVNFMASNLTAQVRNIADVTTAVAKGDLSRKITVDVKGELLELKNTINTMVDQLSSFASEVTRVAREVGTEGVLGGQASVPGVAGTWKDLTDAVNFMAGNLTGQVRNIALVTTAVANGDLSQKITVDVKGEMLELKNTINTMVDQLSAFASEVTRVAREVGTEGVLGGQAEVPGVAGTWKDLTENVNQLAGNLTVQLRDVRDVATAIADGDLTRKITVEVRGEILQIKEVINSMVDRLSVFADEVTRVAREVGTEGMLGGQADVPNVGGTWKDLTDAVNFMAGNLTGQVRNIALVTTAVANGDLSQKITVDVKGEMLELKNTINTMVDQLSTFASEVTRVAREVGTEGKLGGQAKVEGVAGVWRDLTDNVNQLAGNLTVQLRDVSAVATAIANGDLTRKITVEAAGEILQIKDVVNAMVDRLSAFASEVTRVAREVGTEGVLGGQANVGGVAGTWKDLTDSVNFMASSLTGQVRDIALVTTAVANGDLSQKITVDVKGEMLELKNTINTMVDQLSTFASEVTRVAREVGTEGELGGQAQVEGVAGVWRDLTESVNQLAGNLTVQLRDVSAVATAIADGDLTRKITVEAAGEILQIKEVINAMVDRLSVFADEVTRVAREVGTEGVLGGQAEVPNVGGTWKDLTDSVNFMASNLTNQVRNIADVTTAVARGDLSQKITVDVKGEMLQLKNTVNTMVDQLSAFASEVTRVAREVGTEGVLGGQAEVPGVAGTWKDLTDSVNFMASNLTNQVRNIADVTTAVANGDLSQKITVDVKGEMLELKNTINTMVDQLSTFASEVTRVAREVGTEGQLGGQANVEGVAGVWRDLTENVNQLAGNLTVQLRDVRDVATAIADGDLTRKITVEAAGEILQIKDVINAMVDRLSAFASEVTRVAREVGTEGVLGGQANVGGVAGTWRDLTDSVNFMASSLTGQVRDIALVTTAVANGDLSQKITVDVKGEMLELKNTINTMVDQLSTFASEVTRVAREVGTEGELGGQAKVEGVAGVWRDLTDNVNQLAGNLTVQLRDVSAVATAIADGDLTRKITVEASGEILQIKDVINAMVDRLSIFADEVTRVAREVGTEGVLGGQAEVPGVAGTWKDLTDAVNFMAGNLTGQVRNIALVTTAVANGDLSQKITVDVKGEMLELKNTVNTMVDQLSAFASEVTRVAREVGTEGVLGGQASVEGVAGVWRDLTENVNQLAGNLTVQLRELRDVATAIADGDLTRKITVEVRGEILQIKEVINSMVDRLSVFADEVTRVAREVGTEGVLGGQAQVPNVGGTWKDLTDSVNFMASNLTDQVRNIADVTTAVARGDLSQKITVDVKGEMLQLKNTVNTMVDQLSSFASEVTRVAREVGTEGVLGGQAEVPGVGGTWKDLTDSVNFMASNLTNQVRNIADVTTAVAKGDLSRKITVDVKGEMLQLKNTVNTMVDQLSSFASEVTRVAKEVGTEGRLGGQANVEGVAGVWRDLTDSVNFMAGNLTGQVRNIADVTTAVARGDLSRKITVDVKGEMLQLKNTINTMVDQLSAFASEVTRVAREVGTEGKLGGQARVEGVAGVWRDLTDNVNQLAGNLTVQLRDVSAVATAIADGDLTRKITVEAAGEILQIKDVVNAMVDRLSLFADEVTRLAREVGTEGKLGGQAEVPGAAGTWRALTDNVNAMANSLTGQVRAITDVAIAVTTGDLTRSITVEAKGELDELKRNINQMISNLKETTERNQEQDWLKTNLAKFSRMMQGQKDLEAVSRLIMSELTPLVGANHGAFFLMDQETNAPLLKLIASYAYKARKQVSNRFRLGEGIVGQSALEKKPILLTGVPDDYITISSGLGEAPPRNIVVLPVLFEGEVKAVIELASFMPFSQIHQLFLDQLTESVGVVINMISANMRTEELLEQSQNLTQELQSQSQELQSQQEELRRTNAELEAQARTLKASEEALRDQQEELQQVNEELEEKASLLAEQNRKVEQKNAEVESARRALEEKAEQLALSSKYKSEFLANMSHELRTPLNSLLILAKLLADNKEGNLTSKQVEFAQTILGAGTDLLNLINDVLDLSKVEAGKMEISPTNVYMKDVTAYVDRSFRPMADQKGLQLNLHVDGEVPEFLFTDGQRLQQVLKNLLSNAFKFTEKGGITLAIRAADKGRRFNNRTLDEADMVIAFSVQDTGIGIARDKQQLIFEAFQQEDGTTSRKFGGTGLGLSISREITRLLGGEIRVESTQGEGSTFTLFLPRTWPGDPDAGRRAAPADDDGARSLAPSRPARRAPQREAQQPSRGEAQPARAPQAEPSEERRQGPRDPAEVGIRDDRASIEPGDRAVLIVENDPTFARILLDMARERGFKAIVALDGETGLELVRDYHPDAVTLDIDLPGIDGWTVLDRLKHAPETRHIPVHIVSGVGMRQRGLRQGAFSYLEKPVSQEALDNAFEKIGNFLSDGVKRLLVVEDDERQRESIIELVGDEDVEITAVGTAADALERLRATHFDCMVLDLGLGGDDGFQLLEEVKSTPEMQDIPIIIYTGKELSQQEETQLRRYAETIIVKDAKSPERLLDETALFLHRVESNLPDTKRRMLEQLHQSDSAFAGKKVLVVDDDVRNIFSLTSVLEGQGMEVVFAENGRAAIDVLKANPDVDIVLMDVMMPEMDGYETTAAIRQMDEFRELPIISLTAKAMKGDREKSIASGASDYITKPVDTDQLLSLMRVWLYR